MDRAALPILLAAVASGAAPTWAYVAAGVVVAAGILVLVLLLRGGRRRARPSRPEPLQVPQSFAERALPLMSQQPEPVLEAGAEAEAEPDAGGEEAEEEPPPPTPPDHEHEWDVAYDRGRLGADGVWRFPHRCRRCGASLLARDVRDATARSQI
jgi:hypothetical protein